MNKLIVTGAMAFFMMCAMTSDASAWHRDSYGYGGYGCGRQNRGGVISRSIQSVARTVRRIENALTGRPSYPAYYQQPRVIVQPVYVPVRQHRPMYRRNSWW